MADTQHSPGSRAPAAPEAVTRGFLFADLRDYTDFVDSHGAASAASLLTRYRFLVRGAIEQFGGAEIRTEGDSFYVVFTSVSAAVRCGLAITAAAGAESTDHPDEPIRVGVGIHAGETVETDEGYVGSAVNIAARICAQAASGEVLVSETVRALTRTLLTVHFEPRGRRKLKGIADPVDLFRVTESAAGVVPGARPGRRRVGRRSAVAAIAALTLVVGAFGWAASRPPGGLPPGQWTIALDMHLSGPESDRGLLVRDAVQLAIDDVNRDGGIGGSRLALDEYDDAQLGPYAGPAERGAANARDAVADANVVALVGPGFSGIAYAMIPITNEAGLLHCSPANTSPELTKPAYGALEVRTAFPDRINYVRLAPSDDIQAPAMAAFAIRDLGARTALVIDDTDIGRFIADDFGEAFASLGGNVIRRALNPGADAATVLEPMTTSDDVGVVFFGDLTNTGATDVRVAMADAGRSEVPLLSWDALLAAGPDGRTYVQRVGEAALGTYLAHASVPPMNGRWADRYRTTYGKEPDEYAAAGYACVEIVVESLRAAAASGASADGLREAVRAHAVDPDHRFETVVGTVRFDRNGDTHQQFVTFYRVDPLADGGTGDWAIFKVQDFGPAP